MLLKVKNVSKEYSNGIKALSDVSFEVSKGEFLSVVGPSGSGKSTLLRTINRLINTTEGEILFQGESVEKLGRKEMNRVRRQIGMIFQSYNLVERLTVIENVLHGRLGYKSLLTGILGIFTEKEKIQAFEILDKVDMGKYAYQKCSELSGGQKQRVGIARALMQEPALLLCDEPIASLDPKTSARVMDYLRNITDEMGITCIVNLHQTDIAIKYSDRIIGLNQGKKVFDGKTEMFTKDVMEHIYSNKYEEMQQ
ncbi:MAG: phosphonate ABC transporter ATP-binding protein [Leptotrichiaceae bacterium]|nr:phosphonate ABC transporter ATP-binding protein [Leptotrichiaceae bacterium]